MVNIRQNNINSHKSRITKPTKFRPLAFAIALTFSGTLPAVSQAATFIVANNNDSGSGSLRLATQQANSTLLNPPGVPHLILSPGLTPGALIQLTSGAISITNSVNIIGPTSDDADGMIISGINASQIFNMTGGVISLTGMTLKNGRSTSRGGAVSANNTNLTMNHVKVMDSVTTGSSRGGGIYIKGDLTLSRTTVSGNSTSGSSANGGGIHAYGDVTLNESTISGNSTSGSSANGGGIDIYGDLTLNQTTVSGNSTSGISAGGGGISATGKTRFTQSTISDNQSVGGAGGLSVSFYSASNFASLENTILSGNTTIGGGIEGNFNNRSSTSNAFLGAYFSLFGDDSSEITGFFSGNNVINNNPDLGSLQDNGGPTFTKLPNINSLARNAGRNSYATPFTLDQRGDGYLRIRENIVDIGAVELETGPFTVANNAPTGAGSLNQAVLDANAATGADTIVFDNSFTPGSTIYINGGALSISDTLTISGPTPGDANSVILDGLDLNQHISAEFPYGSSGQSVTLENMTLQNGFSDDLLGGGAVIVSNADLIMNHAKVIDNMTDSLAGYGGGVSVINGDATLNHTTISGNSTTYAASSGGGVFVRSGNATFYKSTISDNSTLGFSSDGGGIEVGDGNTVLNQTTVSGNSTAGNGGGINVYNGLTTLTQSTITNNTATGGAGGLSASLISTNSDVTLVNTILAGNSHIGGSIDNFGNKAGSGTLISFLNATNSLFGDPEAEITGTKSDNIINNSPDLGILQDNGGPTFTHLPNTTSPARNMGLNSVASPFTFDQRGIGILRIREDIVDIGAVEIQTGPFTVFNNADAGTGSLRQAVVDANNTSGADTVVFDSSFTPGSTINLSSGALSITDSITINGPVAGDANSLILDGLYQNSHIIGSNFQPGQTVTLENMTLHNGRYTGTESYGSIGGVGGGAIFIKGANLIINHGNVTNNSTTQNGANGGGIFVVFGNMTLNQTTISGNSTMGSSAAGGGISAYNGNATLNQCTVSDNSTIGANSIGGGISVADGSATLNQTTVSGNSTEGVSSKGGGVFFRGFTAAFNQTTIVNNDSVIGGAGGLEITTGANVILSNTILSGNTTSGTEGNFNKSVYSSSLTATNSLFGDPEAEITVNDGSNVIDNFPKLGPLQNNGGPTLTRLPNVNSPAINAGSNSAAISFLDDQRGMTFPRIVDIDVDIGATEAPILPSENNVMTRAQMVKPLLMAGLIEPITFTGIYNDVGSGSVNAEWVETFEHQGIAEDCAPNKFCPNEVVTKKELAKLILLVKDIPPAATHTDIFSDVAVGGINADYIEALSNTLTDAGFTSTCATGRFCPDEVVTIKIFNDILNKVFR